MPGNALDAGKTLWESAILAKLPESLRESAKALFAAPEAAAALTELGARTLAQADYSRQSDETRKQREDADALKIQVQEDYERLNAWYAGISKKVEDYDKLKPEYDRLKGSNGNPPPPIPTDKLTGDFIDRKTFTDTMQQEQIAAANYLALQNVITLKHYQDFGEVIDTRDLLADKSLGRQLPDGRVYGLVDAYQAKFAEKLKTKSETDEKSRIDKLVEARLTEERKHQPMPYPVRPGSAPIDLLEQDKPEAHTLDTALAEYDRLQAVRGA